MGSESIAHEAERRMTIDSEASRARGIIVLVTKYRDKTTLASKR